ncbi:MAG TPA: CsbD family protein [Aeromicrobium sp.]|nr:CsbD family protein [Aeromicrobium sp.]
MGDIENKTDEWKGAAKENVGDLTDNKDLQAEGAAEKTGAKVKQTAEDIKDNVEDAAGAAKDKVKSTFD